jgi:YVTN family beta-propeller protein
MKTKRPLPKRFSGTIRVSGILVGLFAVLLSAASLAMAAPFAYVSSFGQDRVTVVDGANGSVAATIPLPGGAMPYSVAVNPAARASMHRKFQGGSVSIIGTAMNEQVSGSPSRSAPCRAACPQGIAVNSTGTRVTCQRGRNDPVIDATTSTLWRRSPRRPGRSAASW